MKISPTRSAILAALILSTAPAWAQSTWSGASGTDFNWATPGNWLPAAPTATDGVRFFDDGATNDTVTFNNVVTADTTVQSLWYGQTNGIHNTLINPGVTLTLSGTAAGNVLLAGTETDNGGAQGDTNTIAGAGGTLVITNTSGDLVVRQGVVSVGSSSSLRSTLDLSGLDHLDATVRRVLVGSDGALARTAGTLYLAKTNRLVATGGAPAIAVGGNGGGSHNSGNESHLYLGQVNDVFANTISVGRGKQNKNNSISFNSAFVAPAATFRGADGVSRITQWTLGDGENQSGTTPAVGVADFTGGTVDALVSTLTVGRASANSSGGGDVTGTLTFDNGSFDVNTLQIGLKPASNTKTGTGTVNVNGGSLMVNNDVQLGSTPDGVGATGTLHVNGGSAAVAGNIVDGGGTSTVSVDMGVLDLQPAGDSTPGSIAADTLSLGTAGTAVISNAAAITSPAITVGFGGSIVGNPVIDIGSTGTGSFDASGLGSFTLNGTFQGGGSVFGDFTQADGANLKPGGDGTAGMLTFNNSLTLGQGTLKFDLAGSAVGVNDQIVVYGNLTLTGTNVVSLAALEGDFDTSTPYTLISYYGTLTGDAAHFKVGGTIGQSRRTFTFDTTSTPNAVTMQVGGAAPAALTWVGDGTANVWDINGAANWNNGVTSDKFFNLDSVVFDDSGANSPAINLVTALTPGTLTVNNSTKDYVFNGAGSINGGAGLLKQGAAALTLANTAANNLGAVTVDAGSLVLTNSGGNTLGALTLNGGSVVIANGQPNTYTGELALNAGTLTLNLPADATLTNVISGAGGALIKQDAGVLTLAGASSTFDGPITVNAGVLKVGTDAGLNQTSTALGSTNGGTVIAAGATLDVNGYNVGLEPLTISGSGVGGQGAIVENTGDAAFHNPGPNMANVTMVGDTTFGGTGRLDFRSDPATGTNAVLSTGGQPYKFTKVGTNQLTLTGVQVDAELGDIDIQSGTLGLERATTFGNAASNLFVRTGSTLLLYQVFSGLDKQLHLFGDGTNDTLYAQSGAVEQNVLVGPMDLNGACRFDVASGQFMTLSNLVSGSGSLAKLGSGTLQLTGTGANTWTGGLTIEAGTLQVGDGNADGSLPAAAITNNGALVFNSANDFALADSISGTGSLTQMGAGKVTLSGTHSYAGLTTVSAGTLQVDGSLLGGGGVTVSGGTLAGGGIIVGGVDVAAGGTLSPGASIGTLSIIGALSLGGTNVMELNKTGSTLTNDMVIGISSLTLGGTLVLDLTGDPLAAGDAFPLYSATIVIPSAFASIVPATPGAGLTWDTSTLATDGKLRVAGSVNTTPTNLIASVTGGSLTLSWPSDHTGWRLQAQTNSLATGLNTNWVDVADSGSTNQVTVPVDPANPAVFYRLVYP